MLSIGSDQNTGPRFELVVQVRDNKGVSVGRTKSYVTDKASELETLWNRYGYKPPRKKKAAAATTEKEIKIAFKEVESHTEKIRKNKQLED